MQLRQGSLSVVETDPWGRNRPISPRPSSPQHVYRPPRGANVVQVLSAASTSRLSVSPRAFIPQSSSTNTTPRYLSASPRSVASPRVSSPRVFAHQYSHGGVPVVRAPSKAPGAHATLSSQPSATRTLLHTSPAASQRESATSSCRITAVPIYNKSPRNSLTLSPRPASPPAIRTSPGQVRFSPPEPQLLGRSGPVEAGVSLGDETLFPIQ